MKWKEPKDNNERKKKNDNANQWNCTLCIDIMLVTISYSYIIYCLHRQTAKMGKTIHVQGEQKALHLFFSRSTFFLVAFARTKLISIANALKMKIESCFWHLKVFLLLIIIYLVSNCWLVKLFGPIGDKYSFLCIYVDSHDWWIWSHLFFYWSNLNHLSDSKGNSGWYGFSHSWYFAAAT